MSLISTVFVIFKIIKSDSLIKTIGFSPARSQMTPLHQSRIVTSSLQRSIIESQNVSPLIITPTPHVIHTNNDIVPAKVSCVLVINHSACIIKLFNLQIVPIPSTPVISHFSVINKSGW